MTVALAALYKAVYARLKSEGDWGGRVYEGYAPPKAARPLCIYHHAAGGEINRHVRRDAELMLIVKCVGDSLSEALSGADRIDALLNDADRGTSKALNSSADGWVIIHSLGLETVYLRELVDGRDVYHLGKRYQFRMEATS